VGDGRATEIAPAGSGRAEVVAWGAALCFAFFPVLTDLGRHLLETPWARYAAVFPLLALRAALHERGAEPSARRDAPLWVAAGLGVLLAGMLMGAIRWGRVGAALAAVGWCRRFGLAGWRTQALLAFAVPVPAAAMRLAEPLSQQLGAAASALGAGLGVEVEPVWSARFGSGLPLAALLAGLSWYASLLRRRPLPAALGRAALAALLAFPLQLLASVAAGVAAPWLGVPAAQAALSQGPWLAATCVGVAVAERGARRREAR
jgi:hypothetical protein